MCALYILYPVFLRMRKREYLEEWENEREEEEKSRRKENEREEEREMKKWVKSNDQARGDMRMSIECRWISKFLHIGKSWLFGL